MPPPLAIVTTGPAAMPIDEVRQITNFSTGEIGALLAGFLVESGFEVLLFRGKMSIFSVLPEGVTLREFSTNHELQALLENVSAQRGGDVRAVFHAAALSDYKVAAVCGPDKKNLTEGKIPGGLSQLHLTLEPAAKVLPKLRSWFSHAQITAWKYEIDGSQDDAISEARQQIISDQSDVSVINGAAYGAGFGVLWDEKMPLHFETKRTLAHFLASQAAMFAKRVK